jgi:hypothetical protein
MTLPRPVDVTPTPFPRPGLARLTIGLLNDLVAASPEDAARAFARTLTTLGEAAGFDRVHILELGEDGSGSSIHDWRAPGVAETAALQRLDACLLGPWRETCACDECVELADAGRSRCRASGAWVPAGAGDRGAAAGADAAGRRASRPAGLRDRARAAAAGPRRGLPAALHRQCGGRAAGPLPRRRRAGTGRGAVQGCRRDQPVLGLGAGCRPTLHLHLGQLPPGHRPRSRAGHRAHPRGSGRRPHRSAGGVGMEGAGRASGRPRAVQRLRLSRRHGAGRARRRSGCRSAAGRSWMPTGGSWATAGPGPMSPSCATRWPGPRRGAAPSPPSSPASARRSARRSTASWARPT